MKSCNFLIFVTGPLLNLKGEVLGCTTGDVRLSGTDKNYTGRVEICYEGEWGAVCDDSWGDEDARVVCRQLGLPTKVVKALQGFGGGSGEVWIDNVGCRGSEQRLNDCTNTGVGNNNCNSKHNEDAGVICISDEEVICDFEQAMPLEKPLECSEKKTESGPSEACIHRYGIRVPFYPITSPTPCDDLYEPGVDYIYVPLSRSRGIYSKIMKDIAMFGHFLLGELVECSELARRVICHFYFPPSGNITHFQPPVTVCPEQCRLIEQLCPEAWASVVKKFEDNSAIISSSGLQFIECDFPGRHLSPLPHCCSDLGLNASLLLNNEDEETSAILYLGTGAAALVVLTALVAAPIILCSLWKWCRRPKRMVISKPQSYHGSLESLEDSTPHNRGPNRYDNTTEQTSPMHLPRPDVNLSRVPSTYLRQLMLEGLLIPKHTINLSGTVGQGEFGVVYKATLNGWRGNYEHTVAVKTLKVFSPAEQRRLIEESLVMIKFNHMNVMKLIGVSPHNWPSVYIVMPYMIYGSLLSYLRKNRADFTILNTNDDLDLVNEVGKRLWSMCLQICRGMEYLASLEFVHRDLAARNCMIDEHFVIKVSDFGLTEDIYSRNYFRQLSIQEEDGETPVKLPVKWMALESLNDGVFSEKTDVWSFGVTCWEVFTLGKAPYPGMDPHYIIHYLERGERLEKPNNTACSEHVYAIVQECWKAAPDKRPTFSELAKSICESLEVMGGYLDLTTPYLPTPAVSSTENIPTHIPPI